MKGTFSKSLRRVLTALLALAVVPLVTLDSASAGKRDWTDRSGDMWGIFYYRLPPIPTPAAVNADVTRAVVRYGRYALIVRQEFAGLTRGDAEFVQSMVGIRSSSNSRNYELSMRWTPENGTQVKIWRDSYVTRCGKLRSAVDWEANTDARIPRRCLAWPRWVRVMGISRYIEGWGDYGDGEYFDKFGSTGISPDTLAPPLFAPYSTRIWRARP